MSSYYLKSETSEGKAVNLLKKQASGVIAWITGNKKNLKAVELVYLPYWCFEYQLMSKNIKKAVSGKIAIESYQETPAILPKDTKYFETVEGMELLPVGNDPNTERAYQLIYWDAFFHEKKKSKINIFIDEPFLLYVPYWIGYFEEDELDIAVVDATSGKIDMPMKSSIIKALCNN